MTLRVCKMQEVTTYRPHDGAARIFFLLTVIVLIFVLCFEFQKKENLTIIPSRAVPKKPHGFWTFQPLSPKEDLEKKLLLESIAWPETPPWQTPLSLNETSCPANSTFTILPQRGDGQWHVGDKLKVLIKMYDFQGRPKKSGGEVLLARVHNLTLGAGVVGKVEDHLNGTYSAVFSLLWEGSAWVEVTLVHPSEAITVLRRLNSEQPDRVDFQSLFRSRSVSETTICNVFLRSTEQPLCNYTDLHTGDPWFCFKPKNLNCDTRINHSKRGFKQILKANEEKLFQLGVNMKVSIPASGPASVTVLPRQKGQAAVNSSNVESGPSGYYYQGAWQTLSGTKVQQFNTPSAITQCLKGKVVHLYGDSTIRQWFEYFSGALPDLKEFDLHSQKQNGPFMAMDFANNILVTFRCHGPPIRFRDVPISELRYIANELDNVIGGTNTVVIFGIWSHFSTFPVEVYIQRLQSIRRAVIRLLNRSPGTVVIIRTANPKALTLYETLTNSDWYSLQNDKILRVIFKGLNVHLLDAWEMVLAHHLPHNLHPQPPIIKNMINVLLSYTCPLKGG
ncbi:NXPE family member 3-like isoform X11 [Acanthochromis polyacanthus]|uniref:NXPE family member 3-like isoform X6 n=1 Tax=Acanthochromis polyacanthus TaxID=80966 RepID=UPI002234B433|nr:NXPE family member 3-like isoform X6 [Acanthochromis polyacanthus]XP_051804670.1 NXPE family member 3-like isoform X8 [Acanthochromis polyacanthus]XP_051804671.1 NXPE family member 3-like isoform X9 [Acanthochromis polyacanthus]XP_051804672.1 NXPE family member 3-like isoform X10 [Acanthochromis polyacanthus]XP_051804675.1 NXPE family member 3-like isoform X11 [Acanthochromis polyacanthus]